MAQLGKTGGTVYTAASVQVDLDPGLAVPLSAVNALRREVLGQLDALRSQPGAGRTCPCGPEEEAGAVWIAGADGVSAPVGAGFQGTVGAGACYRLAAL
ncbi:MAG: DUF3656 domain-containing protein [Evtepia sp.]